VRSVPKIEGPFDSYRAGGLQFMQWIVQGDNGRWYHTQFEVSSTDLLGGDLACYEAFKKVIMIAEHHAHAPADCACYVCLALMKAGD